MDKKLAKQIKSDIQIWKFCFYGFFKNLKFFEPYLYLYLINLGFSFLQIGVLFSIKEFTVYFLEIPSGVLADNYGKKRALLLSFSAYIVSFIFFFMTKSFIIASVAIFFFAIGEAFRSGTHKAMIYTYLEKRGWFKYKTFVYGRTRSFSLIGSALSAIASILFVLNLPALKWLFLVSILPYILDGILIITYPDYLDEKHKADFNFKDFFITIFSRLKFIFKRKNVRSVLLNSSFFDASFSVIKDYIQPIVKSVILASGFLFITSFSRKENVKLVLGIIYAVFYIFSAITSRNIHRLNNKFPSQLLLNITYLVLVVFFIAISFFIKFNALIAIIISFFLLYIFKNGRRPLVVDILGDMIEKNERATVFSVDSQLKSIVAIIFAPLFGYFADNISLSGSFLFLAVFLLFIYPFAKARKSNLI